MIPLLGFCGASDSGKTTLLSAVIAELSRRGLAVGVIKHHGHAEPLPLPAEDQGKDTSRHLAAGAKRAVLSHAGGLRLVSVEGGGLAPDQVASLFMQGLDLVLVEGFKQADLYKIEVVAPGREPLLPSGGRLLALTRRGGSGHEAGLPVLNADDPVAVTDFVLEALALGARPVTPSVSLRVGGREVDINPFVARLLADTLRGFLATLKDTEGGQGRVEVVLD